MSPMMEAFVVCASAVNAQTRLPKIAKVIFEASVRVMEHPFTVAPKYHILRGFGKAFYLAAISFLRYCFSDLAQRGSAANIAFEAAEGIRGADTRVCCAEIRLGVSPNLEQSSRPICSDEKRRPRPADRLTIVARKETKM